MTDEEMEMENENGYVIYPDSVGLMDLQAALERALMLIDADPRHEERRIEDCDTGKTIARISPNGEISQSK